MRYVHAFVLLALVAVGVVSLSGCSGWQTEGDHSGHSSGGGHHH